MKTWNLSSFEEIVPTVLSSVDKGSSTELRGLRRRKVATTTMVGAVGTVVLLASLSLTPLTVRVEGSDNQLRISAVESTSNIRARRPPLAVLFGAKQPLKWDAAKEDEMLTRAAASVLSSDESQNTANLIHSVLREDLPRDREGAVELVPLGIKLG